MPILACALKTVRWGKSILDPATHFHTENRVLSAPENGDQGLGETPAPLKVSDFHSHTTLGFILNTQDVRTSYDTFF